MKRSKLALPAVVATATVGAMTWGVLAGPSTGTSTAASHVDAPRLVLDPQMDGSDLYAFVCPDSPDMVCFVTNYAPIQQFSGRGFATDARYEIHIDQRGTGTPDLTYRWTFGTQVGESQPYKLDEIRPGEPVKTLVSNGVVPLAATGEGRPAAIVDLPGGGRTLAAKAADSFFSNAKMVGLAMTGSPVIPPIDLIKVLNGNVNAMVLQVPKATLALKGDVTRNPVIGIWATAARRGLDGRYPQMSRMGNPALDVVTMFTMGETYNSMAPIEDRYNTRLTNFVLNPIGPRLIKASNWSVKVPPAPRRDLWQIFFTGVAKSTGPIRDDLNAHVLNKDVDPAAVIPSDQLRLNMSIPPSSHPNRFGLVEDDPQGYPNGRRLGDDAHATLVRMLMGEPAGPGSPSLIIANEKVTAPTAAVSPAFPYLAPPHRF
ncbi:hypothetical protein Aple_041610 [Acrocarpospora pleiomorpha]|uniref:DUF4331 domain-containing protein n=1 Tax=Acrocarpospora pleiomorpha TaxID=90975 RepID=A0A5M3XIF0_9ACTN|nr:DUF4331 domain-containing protein [Acrocarpospora pleiomorpha]GES21265.1 hypothetical protein Aple_041610 [Acrocarpospora pleiomorpha]